ncbi:hypothetical protein AB0L06_34420 [Spirillospora sp. NPDC052269]
MENNTYTTTSETRGTRNAIATLRNTLKVYIALSTAALAAVIAVSSTGHTVNTFMWIRAILLPLVAVLIYRMTLSASQGSRRAFERLKTLTVILPIAIIGVDLIPGVCPLWYTAMQTLCMLPVIAAALITRGHTLRTTFPKSS